MPVPQNLVITATINGGAPQIGGLTVAASSTVVLAPQDPSGIKKLLYEIYEWPDGWAGPASGWTYDAPSDRWYVITNNGSPAPVFSLPSVLLWGKFMVRGTVNDGLRDGLPVSDLTTEATALSVLSAGGLHDIAWGETNQFGARRQWMGALKAAIRGLSGGGSPGVGGFRDVLQAGAAGDLSRDDGDVIQVQLNEAATKGETVWLPPTATGYLVNRALSVPAGVTLLGAWKGLQAYEAVGDGGTSGKGSTLVVPTTFRGKLLTLGARSTVQGVRAVYRDQKTSGTPDTYDWTFYAPNGASAASVIDCSTPNAYQGIFCAAGGITIHNFAGWCLRNAITLGRVYDVPRITNVHMNPNAWGDGAGTNAWTAANGFAIGIDGAEEFFISNFFAHGYLFGLWFADFDADGFRGTYGEISNLGLEGCDVCILVQDGMAPYGVAMSNVGLIPNTGVGVGIKFDDNYGAGANQPAIFANNVRAWNGGNYPTGVWFTANSRATCAITGGRFMNATTQMVKADTANAKFRGFALDAPNSPTRLFNPGGSDLRELMTIPGDVGGYTFGAFANFAFGTINAGTSTTVSVSPAGSPINLGWLSGGEVVAVSPLAALPNGIAMSAPWCTAGTVNVKLVNNTGGNIVVGTIQLNMVIHPHSTPTGVPSF